MLFLYPFVVYGGEYGRLIIRSLSISISIQIYRYIVCATLQPDSGFLCAVRDVINGRIFVRNMAFLCVRRLRNVAQAKKNNSAALAFNITRL